MFYHYVQNNCLPVDNLINENRKQNILKNKRKKIFEQSKKYFFFSFFLGYLQ